jgi:hypothetical protein
MWQCGGYFYLILFILKTNSTLPNFGNVAWQCGDFGNVEVCKIFLGKTCHIATTLPSLGNV